MSTEERIASLERLVVNLGQTVIEQGQKIDRLRQELDSEITERAIESLPGAGRYVRLGSGQPGVSLGFGRYELQG